MKRLIATIITTVICLTAMNARNLEEQIVKGKRIYTIGIEEGSSSRDLNMLIDAHSSAISEDNRGLVGEIFSAYRTLCTGKTSSMVGDVVNVVVSYLAYSMKSHRGEWLKESIKECSFRKDLKMQQEISDFYRTTSNHGALDLHDIAFRGFSCRQYIMVGDEPVDVMYATFSLDTTEVGIKRMIQHSKFQMRLDTLIFNPYICEIPNDSTTNPSHRIGFDFERRKDFILRLNTTVNSSWINEAIQIADNVRLGEFTLEVRLDSTMLDKDGCLRYFRQEHANEMTDKERYIHERISLTGESFMIPRSFIGTINSKPYWGTGQYRLEMSLSESCKINEDFYKKMDKDGKLVWDKKLWKEEWKVMRSRESYKKSMKQPWDKTWDKIKTGWSEGRWVTEIITPSTSLLLQKGTSYMNVGLESLEKKRR